MKCLPFLVFFFALVACQNVYKPPLSDHQLNNAASHNAWLGVAHLHLGSRKQAKHYLLRALKQSPRSIQANLAMAYYLEHTGEFESADSYYKKALFFNPHLGQTLNDYGAFLCRRGNYLAADQQFSKAFADTIYENSASAYENAGLCARSAGDLPKAEQYFIQALKNDPSNPRTLYELTLIQVKLKHGQDALNNLEIYHAWRHDDFKLLSLAAKTAQLQRKPIIAEKYLNRLKTIRSIDHPSA